MTGTRHDGSARGVAPGAAPAPRKQKDRGLKFNEKHALKYGLTVCSRNAQTASVETVMCKFCVAFGKESAADGTRKRRVTANVKYFRQPFRADHYQSHLEINHRQKWSEYEKATALEKEQFFAPVEQSGEAAVPGAPMAQALVLRHHLPAPSQRAVGGVAAVAIAGTGGGDSLPSVLHVGSVRLPPSEIESAVVEQLVGELLFSPSDDENARKALDVFAKKANANYEIAIKNQRLYDLAIKFVACGASYRLAARMVQCTKEETKLAVYGGCSEHKMAGFVRALLASNLQKIALMMRSSWSFAIATDTAEHQGTAYLDVRIRVWQHSALHDFHIMTVPAFDRVPAPTIVARIERCLSILDAHWRAKLLGITTHSGGNTGRNTGTTSIQQGLAGRLSSLVTNPGFYLIWCGVHQLELVVKNAVLGFCQKSFFDELVALIASLRHSQDEAFDVSEILDVASTATTSQGFTSKLLRALKWMIEHRFAVTAYLQSTAPSMLPSASWWVCVAVAHRVLAEVEFYLNKLLAIESSANVANAQVQELAKLALILTDIVGIRRDLWEPRDAEDACVAGSLLLTHQNAQQFIQSEGGPLAVEMFDTLRGVDRLHISKSVAQFIVDLVAAVSVIAQEGRQYCADDVGVLVNSPCVMPSGVFEMGKDAFVKMLSTQEKRLLQTFSSNEVKTIVKEYDDFQRCVKREAILNGVLQKHTRETEVSFAWSSVSGRFRLLREFVGGLAAVVPEAATGPFASDLLSLNWEKPDYRQTLVDSALEGILHARQKMKVELVDIDYLHSPATSSAAEIASSSLALAAAPAVDSVDAGSSALPMDSEQDAGSMLNVQQQQQQQMQQQQMQQGDAGAADDGFML